jgi:hypothetical protein
MSDDLHDELSFVELVGFPHVEGALGLGRKVDRGNGREGGAVEERPA